MKAFIVIIGAKVDDPLDIIRQCADPPACCEKQLPVPVLPAVLVGDEFLLSVKMFRSRCRMDFRMIFRGVEPDAVYGLALPQGF